MNREKIEGVLEILIDLAMRDDLDNLVPEDRLQMFKTIVEIGIFIDPHAATNSHQRFGDMVFGYAMAIYDQDDNERFEDLINRI